MQKLQTTLNSLFIPFGVPEINTRSSAKNKAVIISSPILTPNFVLCNADPRDEIYRANNNGDNEHPCLTPCVKYSGAERP